MKLPLLLLLLVASAHCFYVYLKNLDGVTRNVTMHGTGYTTTLTVTGTEEKRTQWIDVNDVVSFQDSTAYGLWAAMGPGPLLPVLLQLSTNYSVNAVSNLPGDDNIMMSFQPRGLFPSYECTRVNGCAKKTLMGDVELIGRKYSSVVLSTTDYDIGFKKI